MPTFLNQPSHKFLFWPKSSRASFYDFHPRHSSRCISHWAICINHFYNNWNHLLSISDIPSFVLLKKFLFSILMCQTKLHPKHVIHRNVLNISSVGGTYSLRSFSSIIRWQLILLGNHLSLAKTCFFVLSILLTPVLPSSMQRNPGYSVLWPPCVMCNQCRLRYVDELLTG